MKWLALKIINFGIWIYDNNKDEQWDKNDEEIYQMLHDYKKEFEAK